MMRHFRAAGLAMVLTVAAPTLSGAESSPDDSGTAVQPVTDPAEVATHYRQVAARPEFQEASGPDTNARMREWLSSWFTRMGEDFDKFQYARQMPRFASLLMAVLVVLSLTALGYTLIRMTRRRWGWLRPEAAEGPAGKIFEPPEFYEEELRRAVAEGDWHAAWRASWRQFLSRLEQGRLVEADRSRTNREYLGQLRAHPLPAAAAELLPRLVDDYDTTIYGRRLIAEPDWRDFQQQVDEAALLLHLGESAAGSAQHPERGSATP